MPFGTSALIRLYGCSFIGSASDHRLNWDSKSKLVVYPVRETLTLLTTTRCVFQEVIQATDEVVSITEDKSDAHKPRGSIKLI